jgi:hypothetical protein
MSQGDYFSPTWTNLPGSLLKNEDRPKLGAALLTAPPGTTNLVSLWEGLW